MKTRKENIDLSGKAEVNPYRVPDGYFDGLSQRIMEQVDTGEKSDRQLFFLRYLKPALGLVAGFLLIFGLVYFPIKIFYPVITAGSSASVVDEEYYIASTMDDQKIFETLENDTPETLFDKDQLESVLLGSVNEYELIVLNN